MERKPVTALTSPFECAYVGQRQYNFASGYSAWKFDMDYLQHEFQRNLLVALVGATLFRQASADTAQCFSASLANRASNGALEG